MLTPNVQACRHVERFEAYVKSCPDMIVVDPLPGVHTLLQRPDTYALLHSITLHDGSYSQASCVCSLNPVFLLLFESFFVFLVLICCSGCIIDEVLF